MNKRDFPRVHFYDQDFVDIYDRTWALVHEFWHSTGDGKQSTEGFFIYPEDDGNFLNQYETIFSSFFFVYSNKNYTPNSALDFFYERQEANGAIRNRYNFDTKEPVIKRDNPEGLGMPLFAWAEYNIYHKTGNKKRVKDIMPVLTKYMDWIDKMFKTDNGLYKTPLEAVNMPNTPRKEAAFLTDFNSALAINALYMSALGDILNDKEIDFQYKRMYFTIKTRINSMMWNEEEGFYYDLDASGNQIKKKTLAGFWPMLAEIPNEDKAALLVEHLSNPNTFGVDHPFPSLAANEPEYDEAGNGACGSVFPILNFVVIKGLEKYNRWELARECAIRHLYYVLETLSPAGNSKKQGFLWEAYSPVKEGPAHWKGKPAFPRKQYLLRVGLSTISLMIENVIGLSISLPRKTVNWTVPNLEVMGIENLSLKRNLITILSSKSQRGWEIHMESEKLYYFTINILNEKKKTLPIPSGKCSMLIDKL
ncbi:MGH1-like glycoside hydrolase domain-containing protein [Treponema denticola]|uniref:MGH1-like glycoside hydrolase domain-containing protein n=1 Tax=Treponema denticola TaxID=158 RepID=UPI0021027A99|nr:trehalase family glycosidase [Treponema denticola]UTY23480.1 hypothetical protein E4N78_04495 [Treponema denticola]